MPSTNWNTATPSIPPGNTAVTFQRDVAGNMSAYVPTPATPPPAPTLLTGADLTGQTADVGSTTLLAVTSTGRYRIGGYIIVTTPDGASSVLPEIDITWTDADNSVAQTLTLTPTNATNTTTTYETGTELISALTGNDISFSTTGYASGTPATMTFAIHITLESL